ncbi:MAG: cadherin-like beta sandwich domain-containing protein [Clostridiales bacterium]|nr:cadherin-like beta sandwich domain-containing protein [Clostridiales bacterium]
MKKRVICLALALLLILSLAIPAQAALTSLNVYATARFARSYPVYSGPGEYYYRANSGKAMYGGGVARVYGVTGDWIMIGYGLSDGSYRLGYITKDALSGMTDLKGTLKENLSFSGTTMWAIDKCSLTDDPVINNKSIFSVAKGTAVTALAQMGSEWTYVELQGTSSLMRGFVRSRYLSTDPNAAVATAVPKPTATPYVPPVYYPTATPYLPYYPTVTTAPSYSGNSLLSSLSHNCPNTGVMVPSAFNPYQTAYLLTVADWVSRVTFTPVAQDYNATIYVNGQVVRSGQTSQVFNMTDEPQAVSIKVVSGTASTTYTVYLQRRPSEKRTKVSAGYISSIYMKNSDWRINADLVTLKYSGEDYNSGNFSTFTNGGVDNYDYVVDPNCIFYYGTKQNCYRAYNIQEFLNNYQIYGSSLYTLVYIEDEIVAIFPYGADY